MENAINILLTSIIISLVCVGIYVTTWEGMIFYKLANRIKSVLEKRKLSMLHKPLFGCLTCMSSFWTLVAWFIDDCNFHLLWVMLCVAGINTIHTAIINDLMPIE